LIKVSGITSQSDMSVRVTLELDAKEQWLIQKLRKAWHEDKEVELILVPPMPELAPPRPD